MDWFLYDNGLRHERVKRIDKNTRKERKLSSKLTRKIVERRQWEVSIVNFEHILHFELLIRKRVKVGTQNLEYARLKLNFFLYRMKNSVTTSG